MIVAMGQLLAEGACSSAWDSGSFAASDDAFFATIHSTLNAQTETVYATRSTTRKEQQRPQEQETTKNMYTLHRHSEQRERVFSVCSFASARCLRVGVFVFECVCVGLCMRLRLCAEWGRQMTDDSGTTQGG